MGRVILIVLLSLGLLIVAVAGSAAGEGVNVYVDRKSGLIVTHLGSTRFVRGSTGGSLFLVNADGDTLLDMFVVKLDADSAYADSPDKWRDFSVDEALAWIPGTGDGTSRQRLQRLLQTKGEHERRILEIYLAGEDGGRGQSKTLFGPCFAVDISTSAQTAAVLVIAHPMDAPGRDQIELARKTVNNIKPLANRSLDKSARKGKEPGRR